VKSLKIYNFFKIWSPRAPTTKPGLGAAYLLTPISPGLIIAIFYSSKLPVSNNLHNC